MFSVGLNHEQHLWSWGSVLMEKYLFYGDCFRFFEGDERGLFLIIAEKFG